MPATAPTVSRVASEQKNHIWILCNMMQHTSPSELLSGSTLAFDQSCMLDPLLLWPQIQWRTIVSLLNISVHHSCSAFTCTGHDAGEGGLCTLIMRQESSTSSEEPCGTVVLYQNKTLWLICCVMNRCSGCSDGLTRRCHH